MSLGLPILHRSRGARAAATAAAFALGVAVAAVAAEAVTTGANPKEATVSIDNFTYAPVELTVAPGTTVKFVNHDDIPHSVVEAGGKFKSKVMDTDDDFTMTFNTPGEVNYFCGLHPRMKGKVIVKG